MAGLLCVLALVLLIPRSKTENDFANFSLPPSQRFISLQGQRINTDSFKNKVVIINFFTTWCPYCSKEVKELNEIRKRNLEKEVVILGLPVDPSESELKIKKYIRDHQINYPVLAPDTSISVAFGFNGGAIPVTLIYNGTGKLQKHGVGFHLAKDLQKIIEASK